MNGKPVKAVIELENGKRIEKYSRLRISQDLFNHHKFEFVVPLDALESKDATFFHDAHRDVCGKGVSFSFEPVLHKGSFDYTFKGIITQIILANEDDMVNVYLIKGCSPSILLEDTTVRRAFLNKTLKQIFDAVLADYPGNLLKKNLHPRSSDAIKYVVQYDETNFVFLNRLASTYGEWFFYDGQELVLGEPKNSGDVKFVVDGMQTFDMSISLVPSKFQMLAYDYTEDKTYKGKSSGQAVEGMSQFVKFALDESENLFSRESLLGTVKPVFSQVDLDSQIKSKRSGIASTLVEFKGKGSDPQLTVGSIVQVSGTRPEKGGRSKEESIGKFRVTEITHTVGSGSTYNNIFRAVPETVKYPPVNPFVKHPAGQPELGRVCDNDDPDKMGRVKVEFNWPGNDRTSDWMRVGTFYAGGPDVKGMQFIPEKDSQVIVGYELNQPELPFIATSLYPQKSGMRSLKGSNDEKAIYTKAGNIIELIDKKNENSIRISNSNHDGTSITLEFKDDGKITLKTKGKIELQSDDSIMLTTKKDLSIQAKNISMTASDEIKLDSSQKLALKAGESVEISGVASAKLSSANTELSGDAMTTIKGALVKIN